MTMDTAEKIKTNTWDNIDDFLAVLDRARKGEWKWTANVRCKYVNLHIDMRDGGCIIEDRDGVRISPEDLAKQ